MLLAARVLLGIGLGGFWAMSAALAMRLVPPARMPRAMAIIMAGVSLATVCAAPLGAWLGSTLGWRSAFYLSAAVGVVALAVQAFTLPALPPTGHAGLGTLAALMRRPPIRTALFTILAFEIFHTIENGGQAQADPIRAVEAVTAGIASPSVPWKR